MSNSPYPELKALSDEEREALCVDTCTDLIVTAESLHYMEIDNLLMNDLITEAQSHLDRIKQLVLTRGKDGRL